MEGVITFEYGDDAPVHETDVNGPLVVHDVYHAEYGTVDIRIIEDPSDEEWPAVPFQYVLEFSVDCQTCRRRNWIAMGTDPGEYRCIQCTSWL